MKAYSYYYGCRYFLFFYMNPIQFLINAQLGMRRGGWQEGTLWPWLGNHNFTSFSYSETNTLNLSDVIAEFKRSAPLGNSRRPGRSPCGFKAFGEDVGDEQFGLTSGLLNWTAHGFFCFFFVLHTGFFFFYTVSRMSIMALISSRLNKAACAYGLQHSEF